MPSPSILRLDCFCGRTYTNALDLEEHRGARGHFPSHVCTRSCDHPVPSEVFQPSRCSTCDKLCLRPDILLDHRIFTGHCFCSDCDRPFASQRELQLHLESEVHASEFRCCDCGVSFRDVHALNAHMRSPVHGRLKPENPQSEKAAKKIGTPPSDNGRCHTDQRTFKSSVSTQSHAPVMYTPTTKVYCPLSEGCHFRFTSTPALLQHLESGRCASGISSGEIKRIVHMHDRDNLIHDPAVLNRSVMHGLMKERAPDMPRLCPLCPGKRRIFETTAALRAHLASGVHGAKLYHCPATRKKFRTLGGLVDHLMYGSCRGSRRTLAYCVGIVQEYLERVGFGEVRLLLE